MPSDRPAKLTLEHLRRVGRYEGPGGTVFRYDSWRQVWVVSGRDGGEAEIPEEELLEFLESELGKRSR